MKRTLSLFAVGARALLAMCNTVTAQTLPSTQSDEQKSIVQRLRVLRALPDDERARVTKQLALDIRQLSQPATRVQLANGLANLM